MHLIEKAFCSSCNRAPDSNWICVLPPFRNMSDQRASAAEGTKHFLKVSKTMWDIVDRVFDPMTVLTRTGYHLIQTYSIRAAHPVLPYVLHFLAMMCALANGAKSFWFPNAPNPMFIMTLNVNYAQTRKSSITGNGDQFGDKLDAVARDVVTKKVDAAMDAMTQGGGDDARTKGRSQATRYPQVTSCVLHSATPTEFFHRCSGDYEQVADAEKYPFVDLSGRPVYGVLVNPDEAYDMLNSFSMLDDGKSNHKGKASVNAFQSAFNKLAQYGQASRATKTAGSYGQIGAPTVSVGISGNMHFSTYVPMERAQVGSHHVAAKERMLIATGRPIQPHAPLPEDYVMPAGSQRDKWVPLVADVAEILKLQDGVASPDQAAKLWLRVPRLVEVEGDCEIVDGKVYVPDAVGFQVTLPDTVETQVRFRRDESAPTGFRAEWKVANRTFPMPAAHSLDTCVPRVTKYFEKPHKEIYPSDEALALHQSYQGAFNVQGYLSREDAGENSGAMEGAAPWHLGELATALFVFDMFCGRYDDTQRYQEGTLQVQEEHVERAASLLKVVHLLKKAALHVDDEHDVRGALGLDKDAEEAKRKELIAWLCGENAGFDGLWSQQHFSRASPGQSQQVNAEKQDGAESQNEEDAPILDEAAAGALPASAPASPEGEAAAAHDEPPVQPAGDQADLMDSVQLLTDKDFKSHFPQTHLHKLLHGCTHF